MKKFLAIMLALVLSMTAVTALASDLDSLMDFLNSATKNSESKSNGSNSGGSSTNPFDALTQIVTSTSGTNSPDNSATEDTGDLPSLMGPFSGKTITVRVNNTNYTIHEQFKAAMDEYEKFYDDYIALMNNMDDPNYFTNYLKFMAQYEKTMATMDAAEKMTAKEKQWSKDEEAYFTVVLLRIDKKLLGALQ